MVFQSGPWAWAGSVTLVYDSDLLPEWFQSECKRNRDLYLGETLSSLAEISGEDVAVEFGDALDSSGGDSVC